MTSRELFARDGYFVVPDLFSPTECHALLSLIVSSYGESPSSYVHASSLRRHQPLQLTADVRRAVCRIAEGADGLLHQTLSRQRALTELSSITVFPGARAQTIHRDEATEGRELISVFVNLAPTNAQAGALMLRPGSHAMPLTNGGDELAMELPLGSAVYMSSKLLHYGGANISLQTVRPVFYASFGDADIEGPVYSIRDDLKGRYTLEQFLPRVFGETELVTLASDTRLLQTVGGTGPVLIARKDGTALRISEQLGVVDASKREVLQQLASGATQVGKLPAGCAGFLSELWQGGCLTTTTLAELLDRR